MTINLEVPSSQEQLQQLLALLKGGSANLGVQLDPPQQQGRTAPKVSGTFDPLILNRVVPRLKAIEIAGVSEATWDRVERQGKGPRRIFLSERRVGYRTRDLFAWLEARAAKAAA